MKSYVLFFTAFAFVSAVAQEGQVVAPHKGQFYISPGAAYIEGPSGSRFGYDDTESGLGMVLGYGIADRWAVEFLGADIGADFDNASGNGSQDIEVRWVDLLYSLKEQGAWQPFVLGGIGRTKFQFEGLQRDRSENQVNLGVGVFRELTDNIALRADLRAVKTGGEGGFDPGGFIGLTGFIGAAPAPLPPPDSDGDGVPNDRDLCPTTPAGRVVDNTGCQLDGDGDGVYDADDACPETPAGAAVDKQGCALDSDRDGVPDYRDDCPDSAAGALVDGRGCYVELEETVTIDMNIEFDVDKAEVLPRHRAEIDRAVDFLRKYPTAKAVIEGHTDSSGSESYNQTLSERRAEAVYEYLVGTAGISADRLSWIGYGEDRPVADNGSAEGKQRNRRVSAVVTGTQTVRKTRG